MRGLIYFLVFLLVILGVLYVLTGWSYSDGERAGTAPTHPARRSAGNNVVPPLFGPQLSEATGYRRAAYATDIGDAIAAHSVIAARKYEVKTSAASECRRIVAAMQEAAARGRDGCGPRARPERRRSDRLASKGVGGIRRRIDVLSGSTRPVRRDRSTAPDGRTTPQASPACRCRPGRR